MEMEKYMNQRTAQESRSKRQQKKDGVIWTVLTAILLLFSVLGNVIMGAVLYNRFSSGEGESYEELQAERNRLAAVSEQYASLLENNAVLNEKIADQSEELARLEEEKKALQEQLDERALDEFAAEIDRLVQNAPWWFDAAGNFVKWDGTDVPSGYTRASVSVYYEDLESGRSYGCGEETSYYAASLIKAPYIYALLCEFAAARERTAEGEDLGIYDWNRTVTLTDAMKRSGSGTIKSMPAGTQFTVKELMQYAIEVSDNTAFHFLKTTYGSDFFFEKAKELGVSSVYEGSFDTLNAEDACVFLRAIYEFAEENDIEGQMLLESMKKANYTILIPQAAEGTETAHKYGWDSKAYHDMAIVFAKRPYVICIMTNFDFSERSQWREGINEYLREIAAHIMEYHEQTAAERT